jgi:hypothetical protein
MKISEIRQIIEKALLEVYPEVSPSADLVLAPEGLGDFERKMKAKGRKLPNNFPLTQDNFVYNLNEATQFYSLNILYNI